MLGSKTCVDLGKEFPGYKLGWDPVRLKGERDPWLRILRCELATVYPYGGTKLAVEIDGHCKTVKRLRQMSCCEVYQDGDDEVTFLIELADFAKIADIIKPRKKRVVTGEQKQAIIDRTERFRFRQHGDKDVPGDLGRDGTHQDGPE